MSPKASPKQKKTARDLVAARDEGRCQLCGEYTTEQHHRRGMARMGGPALLDMPENLITLCGPGNAAGCHGKVHSQPNWARGEGLMLWATQDPMAEAVHTRNGWRFLLLPDGSWIEAAFIDWKPGLVSRAVTLPPPGEAG
jgi:5-methylcytosine-specific restriction endonuclease McrA